MMRILILVAAVATLAACGEKPQTLGSPKSDAPAYAGTGSNFAAPGWKAGDKTGWEQHLKARQQNSQNDYSRMN
jgi:predicted small lipoprotein YifL